MLYNFLDLSNRNYNSLKINTFNAFRPADQSVTLNLTFGIRAGFNKEGFPSYTKTVTVEIEFTTCKSTSLTTSTDILNFTINSRSGWSVLISNDQFRSSIFTLSASTNCPQFTHLHYLKEDGTEFKSTDPLYTYMALNMRTRWTNLDFNTDLPT